MRDEPLRTSAGEAITRAAPLFSILCRKQDEPFVMTEKQKDGTNSYNGYCIDLLNELAKMLHFTFEIYPTPDGLYGSETENGTWNGMIGELVNEVGTIMSLYGVEGLQFEMHEKSKC